jgi:hypothetical protein
MHARSAAWAASMTAGEHQQQQQQQPAAAAAAATGVRRFADKAKGQQSREQSSQQQQQQEGSQWHWMVSQGHKVCVATRGRQKGLLRKSMSSSTAGVRCRST